jgi:iron(III) transport system substrate-binding protein
LAASLVVVGLIAAACGGDDDATTTEAPRTTAAGTSATTAASDASTPGATTGASGSASSAAYDDLVAAAKDEGEVVYYGSAANEVLEATAAAFEKEFGIKVVYQKLAAGPAKEKLQQETDAGNVQADVQSGTLDPDFIQSMSEAGHLAKLTPDEMPNLLLSKAPYIGDYYVTNYIDAWGLVYNTNELSADQIPRSYMDVIDNPDLKGRVITPDPKLGGGYNNWYYSLVQSVGEDAFKEWVPKFLDLDPMLINESMAGPLNQVVSGEMAVAMPVQSALVVALKESGAPVEIDTTVEPQGGFQTVAVVLSEGPHPHAGKLFANWLMSQEAAEISCGAGNCAIPHLDFPGEGPMPASIPTYQEAFDIKPVAQGFVLPLFESARG